MNEKVKPRSPNAAALEKVGLLPANLSTGAAQLSIPIFEVKGKKISLPISLSYTAKGVFVEEEASNVGLGWILNAGGSVSQEIRGIRDVEILNNQVFPLRAPFYDSYNTNMDSYMNNNYILPYSYEQPDYSYHPGYISDPQPDIFTYNFAGQSGKFAFATLTYESESHTHYSNPHYAALVNAEDGYLTQAGPLVTSGMNVKRLTQISTNFGVTVKFIPDDQSRSDLFAGSVKGLKRIEIYQNNVLLKSFMLDKEYVKTTDPINPSNFSGLISNTDYLNYRLYLKTVKEYDIQTNISKPPYKFEYYGRTAQNLDSLPNKFSYAQDHWGFYNGAAGNNGLCPGYSGEFADYMNGYYAPPVQISYLNANREPALIYSRCGTLKQITYPTGAYNQFVYENHAYNQIEFNVGNVPSSGIAGGIRLKKQIIFDPQTSQTLSKEYLYENGKVCNPVYSNYVVKNREGFLSYLGSAPDPDNVSAGPGKVYIKVEANSVYSLFLFSGSHISYGKVTEKQSGNGTIENAFSTPYVLTSTFPLLEIKKSIISGPISSATDGVPLPSLLATDIAPPIPLDWIYGQQVSKTFKDEAGNKISEEGTLFRQDLFGLDTLYNVNLNVITYHTTATSIPSLSIYYNYFKYYTLFGTSLPLQKTSSQYIGTNKIENIQYTTYNSHLQPYIVKSINSDGTNTYKKYKYPYDYDFSCATLLTDEANSIKKLVEKNMVAMPVEEQVMLETNGVKKLIGGQLYTYSISGTNVLPKKVYSIENNGTLTDTTMSYIDCSGNLVKHNAYQPNMVYSQYDAAANIAEFSKQDGVKSAIVWSQNSPSPIASVTNASVNNVFYDGFEEGTGNSTDARTGKMSFNGSYNKTINGLDGSTYTLSYWSKSGSTWIFTTNNYTAGNSFNISLPSGQYDDVRFCPSNAQMTTYTYDPLVGMTSATDVKSLTTFYEYDDFQRLKYVRDKDHHILKAYCYNYKGQQTNCYVPQSAPQTIYARIEISNQTYNNWQDGDDYYNNSYGDVYIRFYSDASCQTSLTLSSGMTVSVSTTNNYNTTYGSGTSTGKYDYSVPQGVSSYLIGNMLLYDDTDYNDGYNYSYTYYDYTYDVVSHNGSNYVPIVHL